MIREPAPRSAKLARRLAEISRARALGEVVEVRPVGAGNGGPSGAGNGGPAVAAVGIEELLPGGVLECGEGAVFLHERLRSAIEPPRAGWGRLSRRRGHARVPEPEWMWADGDEPAWEEPVFGSGAPPGTVAIAGEPDPGWDAGEDDGLAIDALHDELEALLRHGIGRVVFLDLETGGLTNTCIFLAGTMKWTGEDFVLRQYFARHYGEEAALLRLVSGYLAGSDVLVTFNGKSFDVPLLRERCARHRIEIALPALHVDLLHHARAAWRGRVPNCRLVTLEAYVCKRRRSGDVPGEEIPGLYHDYVRAGLAHRLIPVFHHNLLDVITMDELLRRLI